MIGTEYTDWQQLGNPEGHHSCSPNLVLVLGELQRRWPGMSNMGCYGVRMIRGSTVTPSSHGYGAAIDVGYLPAADPLVAEMVAPWLVARSDELHIGAIHDYRRSRIWHAGRTAEMGDACSVWWRAQRPSNATGMGAVWANHLHLEVTREGWDDATPIEGRWVE